MKSSLKYMLPLALAIAPSIAHGQFLKRLDNGSISVGATGQFSTDMTDDRRFGTVSVPSAAGTLSEITSSPQQYTTDSVGFLTSFQFHPVSFAGLELNYGFTHYSERYTFNYSSSPATQSVSVPTDMHEFTAAYQFHPRYIPLKPFVNVGGGALDFTPSTASNQFRGAGLFEVGLDLPTHSRHIGFRVEGRGLFYRAPNFYQPVIGTRMWRATEEPSFSTYYKF